MNSCPLCGNQQAKISGIGELNSYYEVKCKTCGDFRITDQAKQNLDSKEFRENKPKLSAFITKRKLLNVNGSNIITIFAEKPKNLEDIPYHPVLSLDEIISQFPIITSERINQALINLTLESKFPGDEIGISQRSYPLLFSSTQNTEEIFFILNSLQEKGYIHGEVKTLPTKIKVSAKGWDRVHELYNGLNGESKQGFIAMSFSEDMDAASEKIRSAINDAGYVPMRIDNKQHNNRIDSEIIAEIRRSKFIVADVTQHRNGVYYEAGFAQGLGIPVIWTCSKADFDKLHFDTRQINHIRWEDEEQLYNELYNRIRATIV
ncbi:nucleoside 2-deoxyribosyltransferase [Lysinibacillus capsici]|uniref:nucleoside 2-deoxyribosyltransferase n=1 Tax=Lysinibacillus capsici TaxID=2115968 RepID=UPI00308165BD|nr:nucleoside 2-deoxyribosyltransferase [Lysinibacillus capsici]